jgi:hypothetical protein
MDQWQIDKRARQEVDDVYYTHPIELNLFGFFIFSFF